MIATFLTRVHTGVEKMERKYRGFKGRPPGGGEEQTCHQTHQMLELRVWMDSEQNVGPWWADPAEAPKAGFQFPGNLPKLFSSPGRSFWPRLSSERPNLPEERSLDPRTRWDRP